MKKTKVFVYGTLMGMRSGTFLGKAVTTDPFFMFDGGFPVVLAPNSPEAKKYAEFINPNKQGSVVGEVYEVSDAELKYLDSYEGAPSFYEARPTSALLFDLKAPPRDEKGSPSTVLMYHGVGVASQLNHRVQLTPNTEGRLAWR